MSIFKVRNVGKNNIQIINPYVTQPTITQPTVVKQTHPITDNKNPEIVFKTKIKSNDDKFVELKEIDHREITPNIHMHSALFETVIPVVVEEKHKKYFFIDENSTIQIPHGVKEIFVSLVAGGGCGGIGMIKDNISFSGSGGGAGAGFKSVSIQITNNSSVYIDCIVGKGGRNLSQAGGDTIIKIMVDGKEFTTLSCGGGLPGGNGTNNKGGLGGVLNNQYTVRAKSGTKGSSNISTCSPHGGDGGASLFAPGGKGGCYSLQNPLESYGKYGSAGGGKISTTQFETPNPGGDGFVIVEYIQ